MADTELESASIGIAASVGDETLRFLRDGAAAFPAMLTAIRSARREILLEMYWVANDSVGIEFRDALAERARDGVVVRVVYDSVGSVSTAPTFWAPVVDGGGEVHEYAPISPRRRRFRFGRLLRRDHRKMLVVDGQVAVAGGINLGDEWLPPTHPERAWRDDAIELRGPCVAALRYAFYDVWRKCGRTAPADVSVAPPATGDVQVVCNRIDGTPNRAIRRRYLRAIEHARSTVDITNSYFLPGPLFLRALRKAAARGVRVRVLVPRRSDVRLVDLARGSLVERLLRDGVQVYLFSGRILHAKSAVFDGRLTTVGSHNLDALSWRFNLECNVFVDSAEFAKLATRSFEDDLRSAEPVSSERWKRRSWLLRLAIWLVALFRPFL